MRVIPFINNISQPLDIKIGVIHSITNWRVTQAINKELSTQQIDAAIHSINYLKHFWAVCGITMPCPYVMCGTINSVNVGIQFQPIEC